jgi:hypothetical protein
MRLAGRSFSDVFQWLIDSYYRSNKAAAWESDEQLTFHSVIYIVWHMMYTTCTHTAIMICVACVEQPTRVC